MRALWIAAVLISASLAQAAAATPVDAPCTAPVIGDRCERWSFVQDPGYAVAAARHPSQPLVYSAATTWNEDQTTSGFLVTALNGSGAQVWSRTFNGPDEGFSETTDLAVDDSGRLVCVTGWVGTGTGFIPAGYSVGVACYDAVTGVPAWSDIVPTPEGRWRGASAIVIASVPFEERGEVEHRDVVFVTGTDEAAPFAGEVSDKNFVTLAFDAADGAPLWSRVYDGPGGRWDGARMIDVSPDGGSVFVAGVVTDEYWNYGAVAYDAVTGEERWAAQHEFPASGRSGYKEDWPMAMAVSPGGDVLAMTGSTIGARGERFGTVAFDPADGTILWSEILVSEAGPDEIPDSVAIPPGVPIATVQIKGSTEEGSALAFDPSGERLYVTGTSRAFPTGPAYTTVAYEADDGNDLWTARYHGPAPGIDVANAVAVSPSGDRIYVTGRSSRAGVRFSGTSGDAWRALDDIATVAYDRDGEQQWVARFDGAGDIDIGHAIVADAQGVHVAGRTLSSEDPLFPFAGADLVVLSYDR